MNRGFKYYYKEGFKDSLKSLKNRENYLKYLMFLIGRIIATLFILPFFMLKLSSIKLHKCIKVNGKVDVVGSFKESNNPKIIWNIVLATIIKWLTIISGAILIGIFGLVLGLVGYLIGDFSYNEELFMLLFSIPAILALVIYIIIYPLYFSPVDYLVQTDKTIGASDAVSLSINSMKLTGKWTVVLTNIITYLILLAYISLIVVLYVVYINVFSDVAKIFAIIGMFILTIGLFIIIPLFIMTKNLALVSLYEDMVLDRINLNKSVEGIRIKRFDVKSNNVENELVKMFDETSDEESKIDVLKADFSVKQKKTHNKFKKNNEEEITEKIVKSELTKVVDEVINDDSNESKNKLEEEIVKDEVNFDDKEATISNLDNVEEIEEEIYEDLINVEQKSSNEEIKDNDNSNQQDEVYDNVEEIEENVVDEVIDDSSIEEIKDNDNSIQPDEVYDNIEEIEENVVEEGVAFESSNEEESFEENVFEEVEDKEDEELDDIKDNEENKKSLDVEEIEENEEEDIEYPTFE